MSVSDGEITSVKHAATGSPLDPMFFLTVDTLFEELQRAIDSHAAKIVADYDPSLGYPVVLDVDFIAQAADDEVSFRAGELNVIPEPNCVVLLLSAMTALAVNRDFHCWV